MLLRNAVFRRQIAYHRVSSPQLFFHYLQQGIRGIEILEVMGDAAVKLPIIHLSASRTVGFPYITLGCVKAITVTKSSSSYWEGRPDAESLQRVYGISFPSQQALKDWKHIQVRY